ncbi:MAG: hypothetical protein L0226_15055 [Acidobacteria bacterium]|nr:hypothetical protein [Acidobacteriota bacterium]
MKPSRQLSDPSEHTPRLLRRDKAIISAAPGPETNSNEIDPKLRALLIGVRSGLLAVCSTIEQFLGIEKRRS